MTSSTDITQSSNRSDGHSMEWRHVVFLNEILWCSFYHQLW